MPVSKKFKVAVKLAGCPAWRIAREAGVNPNVLSKIMSGALVVRPGDQRIEKIAAVLGLDPQDCFEGSPIAEFEKNGSDLGRRLYELVGGCR